MVLSLFFANEVFHENLSFGAVTCFHRHFLVLLAELVSDGLGFFSKTFDLDAVLADSGARIAAAASNRNRKSGDVPFRLFFLMYCLVIHFSRFVCSVIKW